MVSTRYIGIRLGSKFVTLKISALTLEFRDSYVSLIGDASSTGANRLYLKEGVILHSNGEGLQCSRICIVL